MFTGVDNRARMSIRPVSDAQDVQVRVILSFFLVELHVIGGSSIARFTRAVFGAV